MSDKIDHIKKDLETIIKNQNTIISEVNDVKTRVFNLENKDNNKITDENHLIEAIVKEKNLLQEKIDFIDESIKNINETLLKMKIENENENDDKIKHRKKSKQCRYDRKGFCKRRESCHFVHSDEICEDYVVVGVCSKDDCRQRHPEYCYSFLQSHCKWGQSCRYLHKEQMKEMIINSENVANENAEDTIIIVEAEESPPKCNNCTDKDKCVSCIIQHVLTDHESFPCLDANDTESVESIMEKFKALKDDEKAFDETACL